MDRPDPDDDRLTPADRERIQERLLEEWLKKDRALPKRTPPVTEPATRRPWGK